MRSHILLLATLYYTASAYQISSGIGRANVPSDAGSTRVASNPPGNFGFFPAVLLFRHTLPEDLVEERILCVTTFFLQGDGEGEFHGPTGEARVDHVRPVRQHLHVRWGAGARPDQSARVLSSVLR